MARRRNLLPSNSELSSKASNRTTEWTGERASISSNFLPRGVERAELIQITLSVLEGRLKSGPFAFALRFSVAITFALSVAISCALWLSFSVGVSLAMVLLSPRVSVSVSSSQSVEDCADGYEWRREGGSKENTKKSNQKWIHFVAGLIFCICGLWVWHLFATIHRHSQLQLSVELSATIYRSNGHDAHRWQCMYEKCKRGLGERDKESCPIKGHSPWQWFSSRLDSDYLNS